ncbi:ParB/RepB/Spo0J family partition protein [Undibacterium arcticum]|uniref:ParB/RepB/Spo0J family partition protein n=1 Tax=Undibacterium arcticum TaxID=1762892 RepID=A0ABV7FA90_9BURK
MSIKGRLTSKTEGLFLASKVDGTTTTPAAPTAALRTGPGQMLMVNSLMKESNEKVSLLEARLLEFEGILPVRLIDTDKIAASKWANRISDSFTSADFLALKEEITQAGGNVQPIKVRPLVGVADRYEIVFGHRRHRACLEAGLPVLCLIEAVSDQELFKEMDRENRDRLDLSPWEQGRMYRHALSEGLFGSLGELAKEVGIDKGNLSKALRLAALPDDVVNAFPSPLDLQFRWAKLLNDVMQNRPDDVLARAKDLAESKPHKHSSKEVLDILVGSPAKAISEQPVVVGGKSLATICIDGDKVAVQFSKGSLSPEKTKQLHSLVKEFLQKK